jgi:hypothetical protein
MSIFNSQTPSRAESYLKLIKIRLNKQCLKEAKRQERKEVQISKVQENIKKRLKTWIKKDLK